MPRKPPTHEGRKGRSRGAYERRRRRTPALAWAKKFRSSARWQQFRAWYLARHPLCEDPFQHHEEDGRAVASEQVHHVLPLVTHPHLALDPCNALGVCTACHGRLSEMERRGQPWKGGKARPQE